MTNSRIKELGRMVAQESKVSEAAEAVAKEGNSADAAELTTLLASIHIRHAMSFSQELRMKMGLK